MGARRTGQASWSTIASELGVTLLVPSAVVSEALLALPNHGADIDVLLAQPTVLVLDEPTAAIRAAIDAARERNGLFDPVASWVSASCQERGWPAVSSDPDRLCRVHPELGVDLL